MANRPADEIGRKAQQIVQDELDSVSATVCQGPSGSHPELSSVEQHPLCAIVKRTASLPSRSGAPGHPMVCQSFASFSSRSYLNPSEDFFWSHLLYYLRPRTGAPWSRLEVTL
jgi:hypothetical protein